MSYLVGSIAGAAIFGVSYIIDLPQKEPEIEKELPIINVEVIEYCVRTGEDQIYDLNCHNKTAKRLSTQGLFVELDVDANNKIQYNCFRKNNTSTCEYDKSNHQLFSKPKNRGIKLEILFDNSINFRRYQGR